ncbi:MAG TPA: gephyrin-like molybdotransferase Glp, partial [Gammaproteobacteria bacterium]
MPHTDAARMNDPSCQDDFDPAALTVPEALDRIRAAIVPLGERERVPIRAALDRVLADDVRSEIDVPPGTNSAMDGYAVRAADIPTDGTRELRVVGTAWAGRPLREKITSGTAARIMTGALLPEGADTVVIQERAESSDGLVRIGPGTNRGDNVRAAGEDIRRGDTVLTRGRRLSPADVGLIASLGIGEVDVIRRPRVAFFSTGDELRSVGERAGPGEIYDSNRYTLFGMLTRLGVELVDLGVVRDTREAVEQALRRAAAADAVITSGGVSVGEADFVTETLRRLGRVEFWKVAMKPGRPLAFGTVDKAWFFGLPGNPVSVMVTFYQFVRPALRHLCGEVAGEDPRFSVVCQSKLKKRPGRVEYQRGVLEREASGRLVVRKTGAQGSGILSSMAQADCFIILPIESTGVEPGTIVEVQ